MSLDLTTGGRVDVTFPFYEGSAGAGAMNDAGEVIVAIRVKSVRGAFDSAGIVDGQPVEILSVDKSPVAGYTRVVVRFPGAQ